MADNYTFKDASGNTVTHASEDIGSGVQASEHVPVDAAGVEIFYKGSTVLASAVSVATSAAALPASALGGRRALIISNFGAATIYLGASGVTTAAGFPLLAGQSISLEVGALAIYGIVASGTVAARIMEIA